MNAIVKTISYPATDAKLEDGRHDFDFLHGSWRVQHRMLKRRGAGADDWMEFEGTSVTRPVMGGLCNLEENDFPARGSQGTAFRTFDLARRVWSIYWVSSLDGLLGEPVHGGFEGGVGRFYGVDLDGGRPVKVAFVWAEITDTSAHWSQAFSYDDGKTWEVNWTMAFTRTGPCPA
jgi:hypothetical protein